MQNASGQCQCGHIRYRLLGEPLTYYACHCRDCQQQSASAFGLSLWVRPQDFDQLSGELAFWQTHGDSGAIKYCAYCRYCGTRIYHRSEGELTPISLKAGTLDNVAQLEPIAHIWTRRAHPWLAVDPAKILCYEGEPDDSELLRLWKLAHPE